MPVSAQSASSGFPGFPAPYWSGAGALLYLGDVQICLRQIPARSVHALVCSPPYWRLRDYSICTCYQNRRPDPLCQKCAGTGHIPGMSSQIGMEPSPDCGTYGQVQCGACYVCSLVSVFREIYRVMRDDATLWLNIGDTFINGQGMIPALVALALRNDGWKLVQDIIWYSPNKMPEPVTNRCTKSHEHVFLLAKGDRYYYDSVAIEEEAVSKPHAPGNKKLDESRNDHDQMDKIWGLSGYKNKRDVWIVPTRGYVGAHYAVFSSQLITPCILAGTSEHGCCAACGRPYERTVVRTGGEVNKKREDADNLTRDRSFNWSRNGKTGSGSTLDGVQATRETVGWRKVCGCQTNEVVPAVVLDPFVGSGTTVATAIELGRVGVGIDLSETYLRENAIPRIEALLRGEKVPRMSTVVSPVDVPPTPKRLR